MSDSEQSEWQNSTIDEAEARTHPETADAVTAIERLRESIDQVDDSIVRLLAQRFSYTRQVGEWKARAGFAPADANRERQQVSRLRALAEQVGLDPDIAEGYHTFVVTESKIRHQRIADAG